MSRLLRAVNVIKAPLMSAGRAYNSTAEKYPMLTGVVTTVVKTSAADLFAQKVVERRDEVDWRRHGMFVMFGFGYLGCWQYYLYNNLFVKWCKPITAMVGHVGSAPVKTFIDQCIHHPLLYFPCFYALKGMVEGRPLSESLNDYREHLWENCKALWMIWVPAQMVNFTLVPLHLRIPFVAGVSFAWTVVISVMRGALDKRAQDSEDGKATPPSPPAADDGAPAGGLGGGLVRAPLGLQPLLNAANVAADAPPAGSAPAAHSGPVGLQQLVAAGSEACEAASAPLLLR